MWITILEIAIIVAVNAAGIAVYLIYKKKTAERDGYLGIKKREDIADHTVSMYDGERNKPDKNDNKKD